MYLRLVINSEDDFFDTNCLQGLDLEAGKSEQLGKKYGEASTKDQLGGRKMQKQAKSKEKLGREIYIPDEGSWACWQNQQGV